MLGFDGVADTVSLVYDRFNEQSSTAFGGSAFLGDWMERAPDGTWRAGALETSLLRAASALDDPTAAATSVLWLHSEYDSRNAGLSYLDWMSAVRVDAALLRSTLGGDAASIPYHFVSAHPYGDGTGEGHQAIRIGMETLAADPAFNADIAARALDINASLDNYDGDWNTAEYGGAHIVSSDALLIADRAARTIAEDWSEYARSGSPVALAGGDIADVGPRVVAAERIAPDTLRLSVVQDQGGTFGALDPEAARGLGWEVYRAGSAPVAGAAAVVQGPNTIDLTFSGALPEAGGVLYYGYGYGRLATGNTPGQGNAIVDQAGLPIWVPAGGVAIGGPAVADNGLWLQ